jgi:hypothetical protein
MGCAFRRSARRPPRDSLRPAVAAELVRRSLEHDLPVRHDNTAVGDVERELDVLLDEQDGGAAGIGGVGADDREHALDDHRTVDSSTTVERLRG